MKLEKTLRIGNKGTPNRTVVHKADTFDFKLV